MMKFGPPAQTRAIPGMRGVSIILVFIFASYAAGLVNYGANMARAMVLDESSPASPTLVASKALRGKPTVRIDFHPDVITKSSTATFTFTLTRGNSSLLTLVDRIEVVPAHRGRETA